MPLTGTYNLVGASKDLASIARLKVEKKSEKKRIQEGDWLRRLTRYARSFYYSMPSMYNTILTSRSSLLIMVGLSRNPQAERHEEELKHWRQHWQHWIALDSWIVIRIAKFSGMNERLGLSPSIRVSSINKL